MTPEPLKPRTLKIATRGSALALWQANDVKDRLQSLHPSLSVELLILKTRGDKLLDVPLAKVGGKGLFVKELERAMLDGEADIAVHSIKDVPMEFPAGLGMPVICEREDPTDAFVSNNYQSLAELPEGACVGTSSLRRECSLRQLRPDLKIQFLRGNVNTRLAKLDEGQYDAIILASAGLIRLGFADRIAGSLTVEESLPAVGQGAVGIECRMDDEEVLSLLAPLNHPQTAARVLAERAMNHRLKGGCQVPIAGYAVLEQQGGCAELYLRGLVADPDSGQMLRSEGRADVSDFESLGCCVADDLISQGADKILAAIYSDQ